MEDIPLTMLGKIVYEAHTTIGKALNYYWKLQALESIQKSSSTTLPREELTKLIDTLIDNHDKRYPHENILSQC